MKSTSTIARFDVEKARAQFPLLGEPGKNGRPIAYLDTGATSQKPQAVIDALGDYWRHSNANIHRGVYELSQRSTAMYETGRVAMQRYLNADLPQEIVFTKGCTESINLVAQGLASPGGANSTLANGRPWLGEGDVILLTEMEHHANIVSWQIAAARVGAKVVPIPITDRGELDMEAARRLIARPNVKVLAVTHMSNVLGTVNPVAELVAMAKSVEALTLVDGAQAAAHLQVDVQQLGADFYALSGHKMYGPTGIGVLYGRKPLLDSLPAYQGGGDMVRIVSFEKTTYASVPEKFEAGTPNIAGVVGLAAAIQFLKDLGPHEAINEHESELTEYAVNGLSQITGLKIFGPGARTGIVSFTMEGVHAHDLGTILDSDGVCIRAGHHCCMPLMGRLGVAATARASFGLYTNRSDVDRLVAGVLKAKEIFGT